jgi:flagellar L-ring protein precursor FlgH
MGSGCATPKKVDTARVASHPDQVVEKPHHGSLWNPRHPQNFLFVDVKAKRVNDIVTVQIVESSSGSKSASTATGRSSTISTDVTALFGLPVNTLFGGGSFNNLSVDAEASAEFDGEGSTQRSGRLTASISTKVKEVLPNGNFFIEGTREIVVNREKQFITLTGVIRPEDILPNNTILSTYVSEAKIKYSGRGVIQDNQGPGWLFRILNWLWPF